MGKWEKVSYVEGGKWSNALFVPLLWVDSGGWTSLNRQEISRLTCQLLTPLKQHDTK